MPQEIYMNLLTFLLKLFIIRKVKNISVVRYVLSVLFILALVGAAFYFSLQQKNSEFKKQETDLQEKIQVLGDQLTNFQNQDQVKINKELKEKVDNINKTYSKAILAYQDLLDLKAQSPKIGTQFDEQFAKSLKQLSDQDYTGAEATLAQLNTDISKEVDKLKPQIAQANVAATNNTPPAAGYSRQSIKTERGTFTVDTISADLSSTKVIVDTASASDCKDNCPVLPLAEYANRNGAFAGINGSYFCPATYPQCAGKTNSFDTLLMNKDKTYFNSDNNVYSVVPAVIFSSGGIRFVGRSLEWGRDTGIDSMLANYPLLVQGGQSVYGGSSDPKLSSKGVRCFVANKGNIIYIGIVHGADPADAASALKALGMDNALGLDQGGSTALWHQGRYIAGPGRNIPNAILFIRR